MKWSFLYGLLLVCAVSHPVSAGFTTYSSASALAGVLTSSATNDFEAPFADATTLTFSGFTLTGGSQTLYRVSYPPSGGHAIWVGTTLPGWITFVFDTPVTGFGLDVHDFGTFAQVYNGLFEVRTDNFGYFIAATSPPVDEQAFYFGLTSDTPFRSVSVRSTISSDAILLDNVTFGQAVVSTPLPPTAVAALLGLVGLAAVRRRSSPARLGGGTI